MKHDEKKEYTVRPVECSTRPIHYDPKLCIGCNRCVDTCQCDILMPNQEKGKPPVVIRVSAITVAPALWSAQERVRLPWSIR